MSRLVDITGKALSGEWGTDDLDGTGVPVLRTTNFTNDGTVNFNGVVRRCITKRNIAAKYLRHGDIIIEKSGGSDNQPVGRVIFFEGPENTYLFNNFTGLLRVQDQNRWYPKYVFYSLLSSYRRGETKKFENRTTGLHNLQTESYIKSVQVSDVSYNEQVQVSERLDLIRELITNCNSRIEKLDTLVKARFIDLFGDPVSNPKGWEKTSLSDEAEIKIGPFGSLLHKEDYVTGGHALVNPSHIVDSKISPDNNLTVSDKKYSELSPYQLKVGDVVMGRRGEMGRCAVVDREGLLCGTGSLLIRSNGDLSADYIQRIISFPSFKRTIEDMAVGQTMPNLNVPIVSAFQIIKPPKSVQEEFYSFATQVDQARNIVQEILVKLTAFQASLMQEHFG